MTDVAPQRSRSKGAPVTHEGKSNTPKTRPATQRKRTEILDAAVDILETTCLTPDWPQFFTTYAYARYLADA